MKSADMPAMPISGQMDSIHMKPPCNGLTKREEFAARAMWSADNPHGSYKTEDRVQWAIREADALLAALEKGE